MTVAEGMRRRWAAPPAEAAAEVLRRAVPEERLRGVLFYPGTPGDTAAGGEEGDMGLYAVLLRNPPRGAPPSHPQAKCQIVALAALYLVHARVPPRARAFVLGGGLRALLAALHRIRWQVMLATKWVTDDGVVLDLSIYSPAYIERVCRVSVW